jgi:hypothetical protein
MCVCEGHHSHFITIWTRYLHIIWWTVTQIMLPPQKASNWFYILWQKWQVCLLELAELQRQMITVTLFTSECSRLATGNSIKVQASFPDSKVPDLCIVYVTIKAQNKWCRIAICYPNFRNCYANPTSDLQFATQNDTQANKKCEELLYKIIFFDCVVWKISKIATHRKQVILSPERFSNKIPAQYYGRPEGQRHWTTCKYYIIDQQAE